MNTLSNFFQIRIGTLLVRSLPLLLATGIVAGCDRSNNTGSEIKTVVDHKKENVAEMNTKLALAFVLISPDDNTAAERVNLLINMAKVSQPAQSLFDALAAGAASYQCRGADLVSDQIICRASYSDGSLAAYARIAPASISFCKIRGLNVAVTNADSEGQDTYAQSMVFNPFENLEDRNTLPMHAASLSMNPTFSYQSSVGDIGADPQERALTNCLMSNDEPVEAKFLPTNPTQPDDLSVSLTDTWVNDGGFNYFLAGANESCETVCRGMDLSCNDEGLTRLNDLERCSLVVRKIVSNSDDLAEVRTGTYQDDRSGCTFGDWGQADNRWIQVMSRDGLAPECGAVNVDPRRRRVCSCL